MGFADRYTLVLDKVTTAMAVVAAALLVFQVVSVSIDVILRYFFEAPIKGVIAFNEWSLLCIAFLGAAWLQREGGHISVDVFVELAGDRVRRASAVLGLLLGVVSCAALIYYGVIVTWEKYDGEIYDYFKLREVPVWPVYLVIPFGSLVWLLQLLRGLWQQLSAPADHRRRDPQDL